jgi:uncharacterized protein YbjT (DUF2867 family)
MILVTGASGTVGTQVIRELVRRGETVRALSRHPERLAASPVEAVFGDFEDPASLMAATGGAEALFLLSAGGPTLPAHDLAMVRAARDTGVSRIVKLSAIGTPDDDIEGGLGAWQQPGEAAVRASGAAWTILRPTTFASNTLSWVDEIRAGRPVPILTGDGRQAIINPADIGAAAAVVLTEPGHDGRTYTLTGPELISAADQAAAIGAVLGRTVTTVDLSPDEARQQMLVAGLPKDFADMALEGQALVRAGGNAIVTGDVAEVVGRPPRTFADWAQANRQAFA